jgi:hypothetical protein
MMVKNTMVIWSSILLELNKDIVSVRQESKNELVWEWLELKP